MLTLENAYEQTERHVRRILLLDYRRCKKWVCNIGYGLGIIDLRIDGWIIELNVWMMGLGLLVVRYICMNWDRLDIHFLRFGNLFLSMNEARRCR